MAGTPGCWPRRRVECGLACCSLLRPYSDFDSTARLAPTSANAVSSAAVRFCDTCNDLRNRALALDSVLGCPGGAAIAAAPCAADCAAARSPRAGPRLAYATTPSCNAFAVPHGSRPATSSDAVQGQRVLRRAPDRLGFLAGLNQLVSIGFEQSLQGTNLAARDDLRLAPLIGAGFGGLRARHLPLIPQTPLVRVRRQPGRGQRFRLRRPARPALVDCQHPVHASPCAK